MNGSCHCGAVTVRVPGPPPFLNACNCTLCMKLGTLWGYFPASAVEIVGETRGYRRADVERPRLIADFCGGCGTTTNWRRADPAERDRVGVNMRLFDPAELAGIQVRYGDRRNHGRDSGRSYREPTIFDGAGVCP